MARIKITKITVELDGKPTITINLAETDAIFITDNGVEVLANHYEQVGDPASAAAAISAWNTPDSQGDLPPLLRKLPDCTFA